MRGRDCKDRELKDSKMTERAVKKQGFKKCRSATFSIDGFSFTIGKTRIR